MTKVSTDRFIVRVWRQEKLNGIVNRAVLRLRVAEIARGGTDQLEIAKRIAKLKDVNAVEVLTAGGDGEVWYIGWP